MKTIFLVIVAVYFVPASGADHEPQENSVVSLLRRKRTDTSKPADPVQISPRYGHRHHHKGGSAPQSYPSYPTNIGGSSSQSWSNSQSSSWSNGAASNSNSQSQSQSGATNLGGHGGSEASSNSGSGSWAGNGAAGSESKSQAEAGAQGGDSKAGSQAESNAQSQGGFHYPGKY